MLCLQRNTNAGNGMPDIGKSFCKDTAARLLRRYLNAVTNLYGAVPLHKAKESPHSHTVRVLYGNGAIIFGRRLLRGA